MEFFNNVLADGALQSALELLLVGMVGYALRLANRWLDGWLTKEARARLAEGMRRAAAVVADSGESPDEQARQIAEYARSMLPGSVKQVKASDLDLLKRARAEVLERAASRV